MLARIQCVQHRKVSRQISNNNLHDLLGSGQIFEADAADVTELDSGWDLVVQQFSGRPREQDLAAVARGQDARRAVEGRPDVVASVWFGSTRMQRHAYR